MGLSFGSGSRPIMGFDCTGFLFGKPIFDNVSIYKKIRSTKFTYQYTEFCTVIRHYKPGPGAEYPRHYKPRRSPQKE